MNEVIIVFDEHYSADSVFVHSYVTKLVRDLGKNLRYRVFLQSKYRGPRFDSSLGRIRITICHRAFTSKTWTSNVNTQWQLLNYIFGRTAPWALVLFSISPQFCLSIIRFAHVSWRSRLPLLLGVTSESSCDLDTADDLVRLGAIMLQDARVPHPLIGGRAPEAPSDKPLRNTPFVSTNAYIFHDHAAYPFRSDAATLTINWTDWLTESQPRPIGMRDVILFIRPDWMGSGSGSTFEGLARYFRQSNALLIDVAIHPYFSRFSAEDSAKNVQREQQAMRAALYFCARLSRNPFRYIWVALRALRWWPTSVSRQWLLGFSAAALPRRVARVIKKANVTGIYVNHFFTYLYAKSMIGGRKFILDTHDLQAVNQHQHHYINALTGNMDTLQRALRHEMEILARASHLIFVNEDEMSFVSAKLPNIPRSQVILLPRATSVAAQSKLGATQLLYVASAHPGNLRSLHWLLDMVWPEVQREARVKGQTILLSIVGNISEIIDTSRYSTSEYSSVTFHGTVPDLASFYAESDIVVLPTITGAGVGIKTIEAILYNRPLIVTGHALRGLPADLKNIFDTKDLPSEFADEILRLATSEKERLQNRKSVIRAGDILRTQPYISRLRQALQDTRLER